jgi:RNA polymerase-binding transcription factor DksA
MAKKLIKKAAKPAPKKAAKPAAKPAPKKVVAKKVAAKPAPKKVVAKKVAAKPAPKKAVAKKVVAKPAPKKLVAKPAPKKAVAKKVVAKPAPKKVIAKKVVAKPAPKKVVVKKAIVKEAPVSKKVAVVAKPIVKKVEIKKITKPSKKTEIAPSISPIQKILEKKEQVERAVAAKPVHFIEKKDTLEKATEAKRYSDADLAEFKDIINKKLEIARKELGDLIDQMQNPGMNAGDDTDNSYKTAEDGTSSQEKEYIAQLAARQKKFIENLENAMVRIENKTYGICKVTGKLIPKERLRAVPHTTLSMEAKLQQYK